MFNLGCHQTIMESTLELADSEIELTNSSDYSGANSVIISVYVWVLRHDWTLCCYLNLSVAGRGTCHDQRTNQRHANN